LALTESSIGHFSKSRKKKENFTKIIDKGFEQYDKSDVSFDISQRRDVVRVYENVTQTLSALMGTGGNNVPIIPSWWDGSQTASTLTVKSNEQRMPDKNQMQMVVAYPMHGAMVGRKETAGPNGSGFLSENDPSYTLTASNQSRHGAAIITENTAIVRRLTPLECERLQGFPDDWTLGQADQHRYKQMGNAVAVPVVEFIVKRLVASI
jgi:DNA (cytosine-5)-methyltransferase 1